MTNVPPPAMARRFTILVVEDDGEVRDVVADILDTRNFRVLAARDGYDAIRLLTAYHVDVMFTDIVMPGLSGFELAAQAKLIEPSLRVLYTTGFDGNTPGREWALRQEPAQELAGLRDLIRAGRERPAAPPRRRRRHLTIWCAWCLSHRRTPARRPLTGRCTQDRRHERASAERVHRHRPHWLPTGGS